MEAVDTIAKVRVKNPAFDFGPNGRRRQQVGDFEVTLL
jgi:hypothetical protein